jgi:hypothetical protein
MLLTIKVPLRNIFASSISPDVRGVGENRNAIT